jgi:hypothetical protein
MSSLAGQFSMYLAILSFLAEASLMLWLVVKGVSIPRRKEHPSRA